MMYKRTTLFALELLSDLNQFDSIALFYVVVLGTELLKWVAQVSH